MIKVLIPSDWEFFSYKNKLEELYKKSQGSINDDSNFEFIINNTLFYLFLERNRIIGAVYYFIDDDKLFVNGFSERKMFPQNVECLKLSTMWFNADIYAECQNRASALCLLKAGFKRFEGNIFVKIFT